MEVESKEKGESVAKQMPLEGGRIPSSSKRERQRVGAVRNKGLRQELHP